MRQTLCGLMIVLFLVVMAALRWGPGLMSGRGPGGYNFDRKGKTATTHRDGDLFADVENIRVENSFGKVRVEVTDGTPGWSWDLTCWANTQQLAERYAQQIEMRVDQQPSRSSWTLAMLRPGRQLRGVESNLTLRVPASIQVDVRNRHGDTEILGVQGGTMARCAFGKLLLSDLEGDLDVETSHGGLHAERIAGGKLVNSHGAITASDVQGDLNARTSHADLKVTRVSGALKTQQQYGKLVVTGVTGPVQVEAHYADVQLHDLAAETRARNRHGKIFGRDLRGNLDVTNVHHEIELHVRCAKVACKNQHGRIRLHLADPRLRVARAETSHGSLELHVSEALSPKIEAQSRHGSVKSDFPVYAMNTGVNNFAGLHESVPRITLKNDYGNIRVRKTAAGDSGGG